MHKSSNIRRGFAVLLAVLMVFTTLVFAASAENVAALDAGTYAIDAKLSCFISAMGGQEFGGVYDSAKLTVDDSGNKLLTVCFKTTPMNIYTIHFDEFVDADDPATIGFYDTDGVLHTAADENAIVTYTASEDTVSGPSNPQAPFTGDRHYLTSMTFPVSEEMNEIAMWLYINSTVMGLQFCDGNGTASTNEPGKQTKYPGKLTLDWSSLKKIDAIDAQLSCFISAMGGQEFGGVFDSAEIAKDLSGSYLLTLYFKTTPMNIYGINFDEFVDADDPATIGFYDANGVLHTAADENAIVTYTASDDTVSGPSNPQAPFTGDRRYLTSMTFPVTEDMNEIAMWLYINSTVMGLQFSDGNGTASTNAPAQQTKYKGTLKLDWCSALGHNYQEEITRDATCTETGEKALTCSRCGDSKTETIPVNDNHVGDTEVCGAVAATCSAVGYTGDTYCLACGKLVKPGEAIALDSSSHSDADGDGFCDDCGTALGTVCACGKVHDQSKISGKLQYILHAVTALIAKILSIFGK